MATSNPKPGFYVVAALVIAGLVWFGVSQLSSGDAGGGGGMFTPDEIQQLKGDA